MSKHRLFGQARNLSASNPSATTRGDKLAARRAFRSGVDGLSALEVVRGLEALGEPEGPVFRALSAAVQGSRRSEEKHPRCCTPPRLWGAGTGRGWAPALDLNSRPFFTPRWAVPRPKPRHGEGFVGVPATSEPLQLMVRGQPQMSCRSKT